MRNGRRLIGTCLFIASCLATGGASAATLTSVNRAGFAAAVAGGTITGQNFDSLADNTLLTTLDGVTYSSNAGPVVVTNDFLTSTAPNGIGVAPLNYFVSAATATFSFSTAISAFAIDVNTFATDNGAYKATLNTGDFANSTFEVFSGANTGQFIGFTSDTLFTSVTISAATGFAYSLDTLAYGSAANVSSVPLPAAAWLLLSGLGAVGAAARRKRKAAPGAMAA